VDVSKQIAGMILEIGVEDDCSGCVVNWKDHKDQCKAQNSTKDTDLGPTLNSTSVESLQNKNIDLDQNGSGRGDSSSDELSGDDVANTSSRTRPAGYLACRSAIH
jgi:hypothetical protein